MGDRIIVRMPKKGLRHFYSNVTEGFINRYSNYIKFSSPRLNANTLDKILLMVKG